jgi:ABC-2 type transport system permease protein
MIGLVQAELLKLRTTRTTYALLGTALAVVLGVLILVLAFFDRGSSVDDEDLGALFSLTAIADMLVLSLGIVGGAGEFRHGTITSALLVTPTRWPVVVAKAIAYAIAGFAYAVATIVLCLVVALPWLAVKDASFDLGGSAWVVPVAGRILVATLTPRSASASGPSSATRRPVSSSRSCTCSPSSRPWRRSRGASPGTA